MLTMEFFVLLCTIASKPIWQCDSYSITWEGSVAQCFSADLQNGRSWVWIPPLVLSREIRDFRSLEVKAFSLTLCHWQWVYWCSDVPIRDVSPYLYLYLSLDVYNCEFMFVLYNCILYEDVLNCGSTHDNNAWQHSDSGYITQTFSRELQLHGCYSLHEYTSWHWFLLHVMHVTILNDSVNANKHHQPHTHMRRPFWMILWAGHRALA